MRLTLPLLTQRPWKLSVVTWMLPIVWDFLIAQWNGGSVDKCSLNYRGEVAAKDTKLLNAAFCAGLLEKALAGDVNIINSELLLQERGIELVENRNREPGAFSSSMTVEVQSGTEKLRAGATLFGNNMPRLISVNDCRLEAYLDGRLMFFHHTDKPGIIGQVGTIFGKSGINIAQMAVGREGNQQGGNAVGVLNLDSMPPQKVVDEVLKLEAIQKVTLIELPGAAKFPVGWLVYFANHDRTKLLQSRILQPISNLLISNLRLCI